MGPMGMGVLELEPDSSDSRSHTHISAWSALQHNGPRDPGRKRRAIILIVLLFFPRDYKLHAQCNSMAVSLSDELTGVYFIIMLPNLHTCQLCFVCPLPHNKNKVKPISY